MLDLPDVENTELALDGAIDNWAVILEVTDPTIQLAPQGQARKLFQTLLYAHSQRHIPPTRSFLIPLPVVATPNPQPILRIDDRAILPLNLLGDQDLFALLQDIAIGSQAFQIILEEGKGGGRLLHLTIAVSRQLFLIDAFGQSEVLDDLLTLDKTLGSCDNQALRISAADLLARMVRERKGTSPTDGMGRVMLPSASFLGGGAKK